MSATVELLSTAIRRFLALIEPDTVDGAERVERLKRSLDEIAFLSHGVRYEFDGRDYPDSPREEYDVLRKKAAERFPDFGFYNLPGSVTNEIAQSELHVGDAIDDIADIARDLGEVVWRLENTSVDDALWYFVHSYTTHWSVHLRNLQWYLCHKEEEGA